MIYILIKCFRLIIRRINKFIIFVAFFLGKIILYYSEVYFIILAIILIFRIEKRVCCYK